MADLVQELTGECFGAIARLRELDGPVSSPETVHARMRGFIEALKERARTHGVPDKDTQDMMYAIVALTDEVAINSPEPLRGYWMNQPLQLHYFGGEHRRGGVLRAPAGPALRRPAHRGAARLPFVPALRLPGQVRLPGRRRRAHAHLRRGAQSPGTQPGGAGRSRAGGRAARRAAGAPGEQQLPACGFRSACSPWPSPSSSACACPSTSKWPTSPDASTN